MIAASVVLAPGAVVATAGPASAEPSPGVSTVYHFAGDGTGDEPDEGVPAQDTSLPYPTGIATGPDDKVYVSFAGGVVYEVGADRILRRYAGVWNPDPQNNPPAQFTVGGPALSTELLYPGALAVAPNGDLYIADNGNNMVFKVDHATKILSKVAGGDGDYDPYNNPVVLNGPAVDSPIDVAGLAVDNAGNLYITGRQRPDILRVGSDGILTRYVGLGINSNVPPLPVNAPPFDATAVDFGGAWTLAFDSQDNAYLTTSNDQILKLDSNRMATVFAGNAAGQPLDPVVPGPATETHLTMPQYLAVGPDDELYVSSYASDLWKIDSTGQLSIIANNGYNQGRHVENGDPAIDTHFSHIYGIAASRTDSFLYVTEPTEGFVWEIVVADAPSTPGAPTGLTATGVIGGANIGFTAPAQTGSTPITGYQYSKDNEATWHDFTTTGTTAVTGRITGLTPSVSQTLLVRAVNGSGGGPASSPVIVVPLADLTVPTAPKLYVPTEPTALVATADDRQVHLSFRAPAVRGGTPLTAYQYTTDGVVWLPLAADLVAANPTATITGLTNGTAYTIKVRAVNAVGEGAVSTAVTTTPDAKPPVPQSLSSSALSPAIQRVLVPLAVGQTLTLLTAGGQPADSVVDGGVGGYRLVGSTIVFTPAPGYSGTPSGVTFRVTDANGLSGTAVYTPTVGKPSTPSLPTINPGTGTGTGGGGGTVGSSGKQAVKGQLQPGQSIGLVASGQVTAASEGTTNKIPVPGEGTYQVFRSGLAFTLQFTPVAGFVGKTTGITYRISDAFGQYVDATYQPVVTPAALPRIDRSKWAAIPADPKKSKGAERRTKAFNSSYRGWDAYPSTALGARVLTKNQATTLAGGTLFQGTGATLSTQGRAAVRKLVANLAPGQRITCEGYADYASTATVVRTQSQNRAAAVCNALKSSGAKVTTSVVSYGAKRPAVIGGTAKSRTENQRVVIVVTG